MTKGRQGAGVWEALRDTLSPTKGPALLILILILIVFISLSRCYVPIKQSSSGTKGSSVKFHSLLCPRGLSQHPSLEEMQLRVAKGSSHRHAGTYMLVHEHAHTHTHLCTHAYSSLHTHMEHTLTYTRLLKLTHLGPPSQMHTPSRTGGSPPHPSHSPMPTHNCSSSHPHIRPYKCIHACAHTQSGSLSKPANTPSHSLTPLRPYYVSGGTLHTLF